MTIEELLTSIADLLDAHDVPDWAQLFRRLRNDFHFEPDMTKRTIRSMYGGMGSFNDLILHDPNRIPLREENDELDRMRRELFDRCL
jgi:hypothetical protein